MEKVTPLVSDECKVERPLFGMMELGIIMFCEMKIILDPDHSVCNFVTCISR